MRKLAGLAVLIGAFASAAAADTPSGPPANFVSSRALRPITIDVVEGEYRSQNVPIDCGTNAIWLKAHFMRLGEPKTEWIPVMSLGVESSNTNAVMKIVAKDFHPPFEVLIETVNLKDKNDIKTVKLYNTFDLETPVPVLASWSPDGLVTFNVGGETRSVSLNEPVLQASLVVSTGAGTFDPLQTGHLAGTDPAASCPKTGP